MATRARAGRLLIAAALLIAVAVIAWRRVWIFREAIPLPSRNPAWWEAFLSDRATLGFLRLALIMLALYVIASVPALVLQGRWIRAVSTRGFEVDGFESAAERVRAHLEALRRERDRALELIDLAAQREEE